MVRFPTRLIDVFLRSSSVGGVFYFPVVYRFTPACQVANERKRWNFLRHCSVQSMWIDILQRFRMKARLKHEGNLILDFDLVIALTVLHPDRTLDSSHVRRFRIIERNEGRWR